MDQIDFVKIELLNNENISKLRLNVKSWDVLISNKSLLYNRIIDMLLDRTNLFYYATQNESTKTLYDTKEYIKRLVANNLINEKIEQIFNNLGWEDCDSININNTIFQGDIAEYLMCILLDKIANMKTIIAKVSLKTSSKMPAYGNDNIFYDYEKKVLYFGEAKFYSNIIEALKAAIESIDNHSNIIEFSYIAQHTNNIIAQNGIARNEIVEKIETIKFDSISISHIVFIVNDDIYKKIDYENKIKSFLLGNRIMQSYKNNLVLVFLPVLSKKELLETFIKRINNGRI